MDSDETMFVKQKNLLNGNNQYTFCTNGRHPLFDLAQEYIKAFPGKDVHPEKKNFDECLDLKDPRRAFITSCAKSLEPKLVARFLPKSILRKLMCDSIEIHMEDGANSGYDAIKNEIEAKGTHDFYHEIGHFCWNKAVILPNECEQREAVKNSLSKDKSYRIPLEDRLIPFAHKKYAQLVGAHSGQFLFPNGTFDRRLNDLDEHFARNFDYLVRGQPLEVLDRSKATLKNLLDFYEGFGIIGAEFRKFYEASLQDKYGLQGLRKIGPPYAIKDGNPLWTNDIADLIVFKKRLKHYGIYNLPKMPHLPMPIELGIRLDITPEFAEYCMANNKDKVIEALQYARTGSKELVEKIKKS